MVELAAVFVLKILFLLLVESFGRRLTFKSQVCVGGTVRIVAQDEDGHERLQFSLSDPASAEQFVEDDMLTETLNSEEAN